MTPAANNIDNIEFSDFDSLLAAFFINSEAINEFFGEPEVADTAPLLAQSNASQTSIKKQAAKRLHLILEELERLRQNQLFTAYEMLNWMSIYLTTINDEDLDVQTELRRSAQVLFQGTNRMAQDAAKWDWRMMAAYTIVACIEVAFTIIGIPGAANVVFNAINSLEEIISTDTASDIFLNTVDGIANSFSFYRQFQLGEYALGSVNLLGATQTAALTTAGIGMGITSIIKHGLQSAQTQNALALAGSLLGIGCAVGMFCSAAVEYMEQNNKLNIKNQLIDDFEKLLNEKVPVDSKSIEALRKINDPVELLKACRELVEEKFIDVRISEDEPRSPSQESTHQKITSEKETLKDKLEMSVRGIAIAQAQANNHLIKGRVFMMCGGMMGILAAATFSSVFAAGFTPFIIQGAVLLSAVIDMVVSRKFDHVKKLNKFIELKTSGDIDSKYIFDKNAKEQAYNASYRGRAANAVTGFFKNCSTSNINFWGTTRKEGAKNIHRDESRAFFSQPS